MKQYTRFWEIDFLRGVAIIMMIAFHALFDLNYFGGYGINLGSGFWWFFARATAAIFILLVGISLTLSYSRAIMYGKANFQKYLKRGARIFCYGLIITAITWLLLREGFIVFGILHFIGVAIILAYPFLLRRLFNLITGIALIVLGIYLQTLTFSFPWILWLGFAPRGFYTFDYFPLLPWFGAVLIGLFFGNLFYADYKRRFSLPELGNVPLIAQLCFLGRHSLLIYLLHQPVLIALLYWFVF